MKKLFGILSMLFIGWTSINAMPYEEAKDRARFLTDKMAYELNLNDAQYNDAYEINLDYFMNIHTESDLYGTYWNYRNADLRYILYDWQYKLFTAADYFFRPVIWRSNTWFFPIYGLYRVNHFYYDPPRVHLVYRGGHYAHRNQHNVSYYAQRRPTWNGGLRGVSREAVARPQKAVRRDNGFRFNRTDRLQRGNEKNGNNKANIGRKENKKNDTRFEQPKNQNNKEKNNAINRGNKKPQTNTSNINKNVSNKRTETKASSVSRTPTRSSANKSNTTRQGAGSNRSSRSNRK